MVPPLVIATAQLLQVLDDSSVNIALPSIQDELAVTPAHLPWTVNAQERPPDDKSPGKMAGWRDDGICRIRPLLLRQHARHGSRARVAAGPLRDGACGRC